MAADKKTKLVDEVKIFIAEESANLPGNEKYKLLLLCEILRTVKKMKDDAEWDSIMRD